MYQVIECFEFDNVTSSNRRGLHTCARSTNVSDMDVFSRTTPAVALLHGLSLHHKSGI